VGVGCKNVKSPVVWHKKHLGAYGPLARGGEGGRSSPVMGWSVMGGRGSPEAGPRGGGQAVWDFKKRQRLSATRRSKNVPFKGGI